MFIVVVYASERKHAHTHTDTSGGMICSVQSWLHEASGYAGRVSDSHAPKLAPFGPLWRRFSAMVCVLAVSARPSTVHWGHEGTHVNMQGSIFSLCACSGAWVLQTPFPHMQGAAVYGVQGLATTNQVRGNESPVTLNKKQTWVGGTNIDQY